MALHWFQKNSVPDFIQYFAVYIISGKWPVSYSTWTWRTFLCSKTLWVCDWKFNEINGIWVIYRNLTSKLKVSSGCFCLVGGPTSCLLSRYWVFSPSSFTSSYVSWIIPFSQMWHIFCVPTGVELYPSILLHAENLQCHQLSLLKCILLILVMPTLPWLMQL